MRARIGVAGVVACLAALAIVAGSATVAKAAEKSVEKQVDLKDVPAAAKAAIEKEVGEGAITRVVAGSDTEGGTPTYYEAKYTQGDKKLAVRVSPDGKVLSKGDDAG